jgi:hypothetical protein
MKRIGIDGTQFRRINLFEKRHEPFGHGFITICQFLQTLRSLSIDAGIGAGVVASAGGWAALSPRRLARPIVAQRE